MAIFHKAHWQQLQVGQQQQTEKLCIFTKNGLFRKLLEHARITVMKKETFAEITIPPRKYMSNTKKYTINVS